MRPLYHAFTAALVVLGLGAFARSAGASCNLIPDGGGGPPAGPSSPSLQFKGALGRIDRLYVMAGLTESLTVATDESCVNSAGVPTAVHVQSKVAKDDLVAVTYFGVGGPGTTFAHIYASPDVCNQLAQTRKEVAALNTAANDGVEVRLLECENPGVRALSATDLSKGFSLPFPTEAAFANVKTANLKASGRVFLMHKQDKAADFAKSLRGAAVTECSTRCDAPLSSHDILCIDKIYMPAVNSHGAHIVTQDPIACDFQPSDKDHLNDFQKQCEKDPQDDKLTPCEKHDNEKVRVLRATIDECGGVHLPFDWKSIRKKPRTTDSIDRRVGGQSAAGNTGKTDGHAVIVPGRQFLASTPLSDRKGEHSNRRKPNIDVSFTAGDQLELIGTVDDDDSFVHIYSRMLVPYLCKDGEACYSAAPVNGSGEGCACRDRESFDCTCDGPLAIPLLFACNADSGELAGMPCTRPEHCNPHGACSAKPKCQAKYAVWEPNKGQGSGDDCETDEECGAGKQCGFSLFDLRDLADSNGWLQLHTEVLHDDNDKRRGICETTGEVCSNDPDGNPPRCPDVNNQPQKCRGYVLQAREKF